MNILKQLLILFLISTITFSLYAPKIEAFSFSNDNFFNLTKLIKKPKPTQTPKPSPSKTPKPTPSPSPSPSVSVLKGAGFEISPASIDLVINLNETKKAFDLKSITAGGFQIYGYPTDYGPGINWTVSSGGMTPGSTTDVGIQVNSNTPLGVYTGTGKVMNLETSEELTFPVKVTVISPPGFPYVKIKYPNGGEVFNVGDKVKIEWKGHKLNATCQLGYTIGPGTLDWINFSFPGKERSYEWTAKEWSNDSQPDNMKITIDCYTDQGWVSDTSDDFFTVIPLSTPAPTPTSSPSVPQLNPPSFPGGIFEGGVSVSNVTQIIRSPSN